MEFGKATGASWWKAGRLPCGCFMVDLGPYYITWLSRHCPLAYGEFGE
jgi:hypothetical protein